jgi:diguanylate cyclase (GGDEF)-like protein
MELLTSRQSLAVLAVSNDRALLRGLARFLTEFGYRVESAADLDMAQSALRDPRPDFLLLDAALGAKPCLELCQAAGNDEHARHVYPMLLLPRQKTLDLAPFVAAGVHDFLARPIVRGEFLARLRAGARFLEFERRLRELDGVEPITALPNRAAALVRLRRETASAGLSRGPLCCAAIELDHFDRVRFARGQAAADELLRQAGHALRQLAGDEVALFADETGQFLAIVPGADEAAASRWADEVRAAMSNRTFSIADGSIRLTISVGLATLASATDAGITAADQLLARARQALADARASGRDILVHDGQFAAADAAWRDLKAPGKLFESTTAADVMTPCALLAQADDSLASAADLLRRAGGDCLPVIGPDGRLAGLLGQQELSAVGGHDDCTGRVCDVLDPDVPTFAEGATFAEVMNFFVHDGRGVVVVTRDERPVGLVTRNGLAALIEPLSAHSFPASCPLSIAGDYLRVPDLTPLEA